MRLLFFLLVSPLIISRKANQILLQDDIDMTANQNDSRISNQAMGLVEISEQF